MNDLLKKYGIKEVADITFYQLDSDGYPSNPVLYIDTAKTSTVDQSADSTDATGGKGNVPLITWDQNRELTVSLEDALFSAKSLAMMYGGQVDATNPSHVLKTVAVSSLFFKEGATGGYAVKINGTDVVIKDTTARAYVVHGNDGENENGVLLNTITSTGTVGSSTSPASADALKVIKKKFDYVTFNIAASFESGTDWVGETIDINASTFPGIYYVTGDTYARNYESGKDEYLQLIFPKAKITSDDISLTMEADGDPSTFNMNLRLLRSGNGNMMKLVKYGFGAGATAKNHGVGVTNKDLESVDNGTIPATASGAKPNSFSDEDEDN